MSKQEKKPQSKKDDAEAIILGFLIAIAYTLILVLIFGDQGLIIQFDANEVPISMLETISPNCKDLMSEYIVFKNYIEDRGTMPEDAELEYEMIMKQNLFDDNCW